jgi:hypothetical protein
MALQVTSEVAALISKEELALLLRIASTRFECVRCGRPGKLPDTPAAVVVLRDATVIKAALAHRACFTSCVMELPGLAKALASPEVDAPVTALPMLMPNLPVLVISTTYTASVPDSPERTDFIVSWVLKRGLHLISGMSPDTAGAPDWMLTIRGGWGLVATPQGDAVYEGSLTLDPAWRELAAGLGECLLIVGTGLHLSGVTADQAMDRISAAGRDGRLTGGMISVRIEE